MNPHNDNDKKAMIDKYRDVSTVAIFQNYKGAKSFPKRRNLDQLARKLRALKL